MIITGERLIKFYTIKGEFIRSFDTKIFIISIIYINNIGACNSIKLDSRIAVLYVGECKFFLLFRTPDCLQNTIKLIRIQLLIYLNLFNLIIPFLKFA